LDTLIARAPPELCVFVGSRVAPPLSLARWRAAGELAELGLQDLRFDWHAAQALSRQRGLLPSEEALRSALARTHGWVAAARARVRFCPRRAARPPTATCSTTSPRRCWPRYVAAAAVRAV
jgi:LuxR family maltose regulon positive regulatory protein